MDLPRLRIDWSFTWVATVFLITGHLNTALSAIIAAEQFRHLSAKNDDLGSPNHFGKTNDYKAYIPNEWREVPLEPEPPRIEIQLLKGHVLPENENWAFSKEYIYSSKNFRPNNNMDSVNQGKNSNVEEKKEDQKATETTGENGGALGNPQDRIIPQIGSRNIITGPSYCPKGQRKDIFGKCRTVIGYP